MAGPKLLPEIGTGLGTTANPLVRPETEPVAQPAQQVSQPSAPSGKYGQQDRSKPNLNKLMKMRRSILNDLSKGKRTEDQIMDDIYASGITDSGAIEVVLSEDLTDNVIRFFLDRTDNDPKKAFKLARKFGFEV